MVSGRDGMAESLSPLQGRMDVSRASLKPLAHVSFLGLFCFYSRFRGGAWDWVALVV